MGNVPGSVNLLGYKTCAGCCQTAFNNHCSKYDEVNVENKYKTLQTLSHWGIELHFQLTKNLL